MIITKTAIAFILLSVGLGFCGWRFWRAFPKNTTDRKTGLLISLYFISFSLQDGIMGFGSLFFGGTERGLFFVLFFGNLFLVFPALIGVYTAFYIFSPKISPKPLMLLCVILVMLATIFLILSPSSPIVTDSGSIDWNMSFPYSLTIFYLLFLSVGSSFYIFFKLFLKTSSLEIKALSFLLSLLAFMGVADALVRFVFLHNASASFRTHIYDLGIGLIGIGFILALLIVPLVKKRLC